MKILFSDESLSLVFALVFVALLRESLRAWREHRPSFALAYLFPVGVFVFFYFYLAWIPGLTTAPGDTLTLIVRPALVAMALILAIQFNRDLVAKWYQPLAPYVQRLTNRFHLFCRRQQ